MIGAQTTRIPAVPLRSPMFDEHGNLTRTWIIFFERLGQLGGGGGGETAAGEPYLITWGCGIGSSLIVAADVAPHYVVRRPGTALSVCGVAKTWPTGADLIVDIKRTPAAGGAAASIFGATKLVFPAGASALVEQLVFATSGPYPFDENDVLTLDVVQIGSAVAGRDVTVELEIQTAD